MAISHVQHIINRAPADVVRQAWISEVASEYGLPYQVHGFANGHTVTFAKGDISKRENRFICIIPMDAVEPDARRIMLDCLSLPPLSPTSVKGETVYRYQADGQTFIDALAKAADGIDAAVNKLHRKAMTEAEVLDAVNWHG